ncbi:MAG: efflux RND transporter periplasmic adaptor subunit [Gemmatimonadetes bacterium]|nr:efflux RND transporter periplasmic adaptor subunit [Gemmatimonadota bacterium]
MTDLPPRPATPRVRLRPAALATLLLLLPACKGKDAAAAADPAPGGADSAAASAGGSLSLPVTGAPVRKGDLVLTIATTGQVRSEAVAQLKVETNGTVDEVLVAPGATVRKGQPLVRLDPRPFDLAVREAETALDEARIRLQANLATDSILLTNAQDAERQRNAVTLSGVPGAEVRLERARLDRERATITAPFDGVVDRLEVAAGSRVSAGQDLATVVDMTHLRLEAQVLEHDLPYVKVGGEARVSAPGAGTEPLRGRITAVLPLVDTVARAGRVVVSVGGAGTAGPHGRAGLKPGMYADLRLEAARLPNRILVPAAAVIERDGRPLVFVARDGRAQWVYIVPGRSNGADTEVLPDSASGEIPVGIGDTVLTSGHLTLTHDAPVRVTAVPPRP